MPHPQRYTFISDPTDEFPNNKNNSFKVRLPTQLQLPGEQWYVSLWSMSVPDEKFTTQFLFGDIKYVLDISMTIYKLDQYNPVNAKWSRITTTHQGSKVTIANVFSKASPVKTGVDFWQNVHLEMDRTIQQKLYQQVKLAPTISNFHGLPHFWRPTIEWDGEDFIVPAVKSTQLMDSNQATSAFGIQLDVAVQFGFINEAKTSTGPNVKADYPTYKEEGTYIDSSLLSSHTLKGDTQQGVLTPDVDTSIPTVNWVYIQGNYIYFSRALKWTFTRINASFEAMLNTKETVMIYSDLVQSSVVGSGRFPLLREVTLKRTGEGRVTVEPYHREWIPIRSKTIDIVEIELATASGPLTQLSDGKTIITVGLQHEGV